ncbi:MAG: polysaccharide deacetylase family protein [Pseudomonadales bacterium]
MVQQIDPANPDPANCRSAKVVLGATLLMVLTVLGIGCTREAEPRWLIKALPGSYPEVVYFVPTRQRSIALTIDDGLDAATTPAILDVLQSHQVTATFFLVSNSLPGNESLVRRMLAEGHEIGHHMTRDRVTVSLPSDELASRFTEAADALEAFAPITWFRPGSARYNDQLLQLTRDRGYRIALASVAPLDTLIENPQRVATYINWMVEPGSVVVLHDVDARGRRTAQTLEILLPMLQDRGYAVMSLGRLDAQAGQPGADSKSAIPSGIESRAIRQASGTDAPEASAQQHIRSEKPVELMR